MKFTVPGIIEFTDRFQSDKDCFEYLAYLKWGDQEYSLKKCVRNAYSSGKKPFGLCCSRCDYDESPTARTLFHKIKFSLLKAFYITLSKKQKIKQKLSRKCINFPVFITQAHNEDQVMAAWHRSQVHGGLLRKLSE